MAEGKVKTVYVCNKCAYESIQWYGKCPGCGSWNTLEEEVRQPDKKIKRTDSRKDSENMRAIPVKDITFTDAERMNTGRCELDRVFGGGVVKGSVSLIGGDPGIGKSTLLLQICEYLKQYKVLYISGEESLAQLKLRANRLGVKSDNLFFSTLTEVDKIIALLEKEKPQIAIIDSIQTVYSSEISSIPGSISQIKETALRLTDFSKSNNITTFFVGHINKDGAIAGPKVLEHMVDVVLYFEGDRNTSNRILRAIKNRFGSTNEIGIFDMTMEGLCEVKNPSSVLLSGRPENVSGTCVTTILEGTRPILTEIQALLVRSSYAAPRRTASGIDINRAAMLLAVIEKRAGLKVSMEDVFLNAVGGLRLTETAVDLAICIAMASSLLDRSVKPNLVAIGEVGLAGEIRAVSCIEDRINEAARLGFTHFIVSKHNKINISNPDITISKVENIAQAIDVAL